MIPPYYTFQIPIKIVSGQKALESVPEEMGQLGTCRPMVLTTPELVRTGAVSTVLEAFRHSDLTIDEIYQIVPKKPTAKLIRDLANSFIEQEYDGLLAIGGGTVIHTGKYLEQRLTGEGPSLLPSGAPLGGGIPLKIPFIAIPALPGSGPEAPCAVFAPAEELKGDKEPLSAACLPDLVVVDGRLSRPLSPLHTAASAMDTLSHAIDAYTAPDNNPMRNGYALSAILLVRDHLRRAVRHSGDKEARLGLANGAMLASVASAHAPQGLTRNVAQCLGWLCNIPQTMAESVLLPHCMEYEMPRKEEAYAELLLPLAGSEIYSDTDRQDRGRKTVYYIKNLVRTYQDICGLPTGLAQLDVKRSAFGAIAEGAARRLASQSWTYDRVQEDVFNILNLAY